MATPYRSSGLPAATPAAARLLLDHIDESTHRITSRSYSAATPAVKSGYSGDIFANMAASGATVPATTTVNPPPGGSGGIDPRAHYLLAAAGLNAEELTSSVYAFDFGSAFGHHPQQSQMSADASEQGYSVPAYLAQQREQLILNAIEDSHQQTWNDFHAEYDAIRARQWADVQGLLLQELGRSDYSSGSMFGDAANATSGVQSSPANAYTSTPRRPTGTIGTLNKPVTSPAPKQGQPATVLSNVARGEKLADVVIAMNSKQRVHQTPFSAAKMFAAAYPTSAATEGDQVSSALSDIWSLIEWHGSDASSAVHACDAVKPSNEGHHAPWRTGQTGTLAAFRRRTAAVSRAWLERGFNEYMSRMISKYPHDARLGGQITVEARIKAFINVQFSRLATGRYDVEVTSDNTAIWAMFYYLMRAGHYDQLLPLAARYADDIAASLPRFTDYLRAYLAPSTAGGTGEVRALSPILQAEATRDYYEVLRSEDPQSGSFADQYKLALLMILSRCDASPQASCKVASGTTDDYLWFQLMLVSEQTAGNGAYTLDDLAQFLLFTCGPRHFDPHGHNPLVFTKILLLAGLFEVAVDYLLQSSTFAIESVHVAISLAQVGLLRQSATNDAGSVFANASRTHVTGTRANNAWGAVAVGYAGSGDDSTYFDSDKVAFDFNRLIANYAIHIKESRPDAAVHYALLLCMDGLFSNSPATAVTPTGFELPLLSEQQAVAKELIERILLDTQQFVLVLGEAIVRAGPRDATKAGSAHGSSKMGILEMYGTLMQVDNPRQLVLQVAHSLAEHYRVEGAISEAVELYHLAEEYDTALAAIASELSANLSAAASSSEDIASDENASQPAVLPGDQFVEFARRVHETYSTLFSSGSAIGEPAGASDASLRTVRTLLVLCDFRRQYIIGQYESALSVISDADIFPLVRLSAGSIGTLLSGSQAQAMSAGSARIPQMDVQWVLQRTEEFSRRQPEVILRHVPELTLMIAECIARVYDIHRGNAAPTAQNRRAIMETLTNMGRSLSVFTSSLSTSLPADVYPRINRILVRLV
ncbi:NIC-domain-containing protein [Ramicandelaber brevisporus]|nr:NIC-domain-containing protein [Ramicandelaber brevisporus]